MTFIPSPINPTTTEAKPSPFIAFTQRVIPATFDQSLSYQEALYALLHFLQKEVVPTINANAEVTEQQTKVIEELVKYVNEYFDNLDVQEEINNKLDEMAEDGTLAEIVTAYLNVKSILAYNTIAEMSSATNIIEGSFLAVYGLNALNDHNITFYKARQIRNTDIVDGINLVALADQDLVAEIMNNPLISAYPTVSDMISANLLEGQTVRTLGYYSVGDFGDNEYIISSTESAFGIELDNGLYANPVIKGEEIIANKLSVKCDKTFDNKDILQAVIDYAALNNKIVVINGYAYTSQTINTKGVLIKGLGEINLIPVSYNSTIGFNYLKNTGDGASITFAQYVQDQVKKGSGIISDTANPILSRPHSDGRVKLENINIVGWLRNNLQEGIATSYTNDDSYLNGSHYFKNVTVTNCGNNGIHLQSLEEATVENLNCRLNGGHGLYIECPDGKDAPVEYTTIHKGMFDANFKNGIHIKNAFRKQLTIDGCNFSRNGLYAQVNILPSETQYENYGGVKIEGKQSINISVNQLNLTIKNCYAEQCCILANLNFINTDQASRYIVNNITITNNIIYGITNVNTTICYLNAYYADRFTFNHNYLNGSGDLFIPSSAVTTRLYPSNCDATFYNFYNFGKTFTPHTNGTLTRKEIYVEDNTVHLNFLFSATGSIPAYQNIITDMITPVANITFPVVYSHNDTPAIKTMSLYTNGGFTINQALSNGDTLIINASYKMH